MKGWGWRARGGVIGGRGVPVEGQQRMKGHCRSAVAGDRERSGRGQGSVPKSHSIFYQAARPYEISLPMEVWPP